MDYIDNAYLNDFKTLELINSILVKHSLWRLNEYNNISYCIPNRHSDLRDKLNSQISSISKLRMEQKMSEGIGNAAICMLILIFIAILASAMYHGFPIIKFKFF